MHALETIIDGRPGHCVDPMDRGLHYGDGLFETLRVVQGRIPFLPWHAERLQEGCRRLELEMPAEFEKEATLVAAHHPDAVLKFVLTSGSGERGYARNGSTPHRYWHVFPAPTRIDADSGMRIRWCRHRLSHQPALARIKHLNRLDQVLARSEWSDPEIEEGILCDQDGHPVEGVQSNLFWMRNGVLHTPALEVCGVAGILRRAVLGWARQEGIGIVSRRFDRNDLLEAEEVFMTSSVRGIRPVVALEAHTWPIGPASRRFARRLAAVLEGNEGLPA